MTDLQVKWQALQEQKRANQAQEELKARDVSTNEFKAQLEAQQVPARVAQLLASADLNDAQRGRITHEIDKIQAEIDRINSDTRLNDLERRARVAELLNYGADNFVKIFGTNSLSDNNIFDFVKSIFSGFVNSAGKAVGTLLFK